MILGASHYDRRPGLDNECFARSKRDLLDVIVGVAGLRRELDIVDYFDHPELRTWADIARDLGERLDALEQGDAGTRAEWPLLVFYIGHGEKGEGGVRLGLAGSDERFSAGTALTGEMLGSLFNERARGRPHYYVVDACYGGLLATDLQSEQSWNGGGVVVLSAARDEVAVVTPVALHSVFTGLLIDALRHGTSFLGPVTIRELHAAIARDVTKAPGRVAPPPHLDVVPPPHGRLGREDLLDLPLFDNPGEMLVPVVVGSTWDVEAARDQRLRTAVDVIASTDQVTRIEESVGKRVSAPFEAFTSDAVAADAFAFKRAATALAGADLAFVDLTDYEPIVMVLLGIRAAVTRGVTVCSAQVDEYDRVLRSQPFHMHEVPLAKHGFPVTRHAAEELATRAAAGLSELKKLPHSYQDLPVFDALRNTHGPGETRLQRAWHEYALVLCPFGASYTNLNWEALRVNIPKAINHQRERQGRPPTTPTIARTLDLDSPRTVSHALFEALRRTQLCIFDLTHWRPGVLFELGIRLAVNRVPPVCVVDATQLAELRNLGDLTDDEWDDKWRRAGPTSAYARRISAQALGLVDLLHPIEYDPYSDDLKGNIAGRLAAIADPFSVSEPNPQPRADDEDFRWHVWRHVHADYDAHASAESILLDPVLRDAGRDVDAGQRYLVYPAGSPIWRSIREATAERQFMAWLYLRSREAHGGLDSELSALQVVLAQSLHGLVKSGHASSWIAAAITDSAATPTVGSSDGNHAWPADPMARANARRAVARTLQANGRFAEAQISFADAASELQTHLDELAESDGSDGANSHARKVASLLTQLWGGAGGNARRLERWPQALEYYRIGFEVERNPRWGLVDSYMLTNYYTARLAVDPTCYDDIVHDLVSAASLVRDQVSGPRSDQWWAWADAAQLSTLAHEFAMGDLGFREYLERGDPSSFATSGEVLRLLGERLATAGKLDVSRELSGWAERLLDVQLVI